MDKDKLIIKNEYSFLLLENDYKTKMEKDYLEKINNKDYGKLDIVIKEMLGELGTIEEDKQSDYKDYYNTYEQILSYKKMISSHKELAINILSPLHQSIKENDFVIEDVNPFLEYLIFKKYSLYFRSYWFCMPYLKFSDKLFSENNIEIEKLLNTEKNESHRFQLYDIKTDQDNEDEIQYYKFSNEQVNYLLENLKNSKEDTRQEFYVLQNALLKSKTNDYILLYTKM